MEPFWSILLLINDSSFYQLIDNNPDPQSISISIAVYLLSFQTTFYSLSKFVEVNSLGTSWFDYLSYQCHQLKDSIGIDSDGIIIIEVFLDLDQI